MVDITAERAASVRTGVLRRIDFSWVNSVSRDDAQRLATASGAVVCDYYGDEYVPRRASGP